MAVPQSDIQDAIARARYGIYQITKSMTAFWGYGSDATQSSYDSISNLINAILFLKDYLKNQNCASEEDVELQIQFINSIFIGDANCNNATYEPSIMASEISILNILDSFLSISNPLPPINLQGLSNDILDTISRARYAIYLITVSMVEKWNNGGDGTAKEYEDLSNLINAINFLVTYDASCVDDEGLRLNIQFINSISLNGVDCNNLIQQPSIMASAISLSSVLDSLSGLSVPLQQIDLQGLSTNTLDAISRARYAIYLITLSMSERWSSGGDGTSQEYEDIGNLINAINFLISYDASCVDDEGLWLNIQFINSISINGVECNTFNFNNFQNGFGGGGFTPFPPAPLPFSDCCNFNGQRPITSLPRIGDNYNTITLGSFLELAFFRPFPLASILTGGGTRERGGSTVVTLNWNVVVGSLPIIGIVVDSVVIVPTGTTQNGIQPALAIQNINTTFNMEATDGTNTTQSSTQVLWSLYKWFGSVPVIPANSAGVRALSGSVFGNGFTIHSGTVNLNFVFWLQAGVSLISVIDEDALNLNITGDFTSSALQVNDAGGTPQNGTLYVKTNLVPFLINHRLNVMTS